MDKRTRAFENVTVAQIEGAMEVRQALVKDVASEIATNEIPVATQQGEGKVSQEVLDTLNKLLETGQFFIFAKLGHVTVKIKALYLNPFDYNYVDMLVSEEPGDVKITQLWDIGLVMYVGHRPWLW